MSKLRVYVRPNVEVRIGSECSVTVKGIEPNGSIAIEVSAPSYMGIEWDKPDGSRRDRGRRPDGRRRAIGGAR